MWSRSARSVYIMILTPSSILDPGGLALVPKRMLVEQVLGHLVVVGVHAGEVGDVVAQLLDGLHLLVEVVGLQEVTQLSMRIGKQCQQMVQDWSGIS